MVTWLGWRLWRRKEVERFDMWREGEREEGFFLV